MTDHTRLDPAPEQPGPAGCGVQGCLFAAVALFVVLLIALLVIAAIRFSSPPQPRFGIADAAPHGLPAAPDQPRG